MPTTPTHKHFNPHPKHNRWYPTRACHVTNALRHAAKHLEPRTGTASHRLSARSLRPGGATALLCANVDSNHVQLLGRWKSDAVFRYLRTQVATRNLSQKTLDHGSYTFAPGTYDRPDPVPQQVPADVAATLAHVELYDDG